MRQGPLRIPGADHATLVFLIFPIKAPPQGGAGEPHGMREGPLRIPGANHATLVFYWFFPIKAPPQGGVGEPLECAKAPCAFQGWNMPPSFLSVFSNQGGPTKGSR